MNKIKTLQWLVALLVLFNVSTIATIVYHNYQDNIDKEAIVVDAETENRLNGRYFRHTLGFDNDQMDAFREANHVFQPRANEIISKIDSLKNEIYTELKKTDSDTMRLNQLAMETGQMHTELKKETNAYYIKIKRVCTAEQIKQLEEVFSPLFKNKSCDGQGMRHRRNGNGFRNQ